LRTEELTFYLGDTGIYTPGTPPVFVEDSLPPGTIAEMTGSGSLLPATAYRVFYMLEIVTDIGQQVVPNDEAGFTPDILKNGGTHRELSEIPTTRKGRSASRASSRMNKMFKGRKMLSTNPDIDDPRINEQKQRFKAILAKPFKSLPPPTLSPPLKGRPKSKIRSNSQPDSGAFTVANSPLPLFMSVASTKPQTSGISVGDTIINNYKTDESHVGWFIGILVAVCLLLVAVIIIIYLVCSGYRMVTDKNNEVRLTMYNKKHDDRPRVLFGANTEGSTSTPTKAEFSLFHVPPRSSQLMMSQVDTHNTRSKTTSKTATATATTTVPKQGFSLI